MLWTIFHKSLYLDWESSTKLFPFDMILLPPESTNLMFEMLLNIFSYLKEYPSTASEHSFCQSVADCFREWAQVLHPGIKCWSFLTFERQVQETLWRHSRICEQTEFRSWKLTSQLGSQHSTRSQGIAGRWSWRKPQMSSVSFEVTLLQSTLFVEEEVEYGLTSWDDETRLVQIVEIGQRVQRWWVDDLKNLWHYPGIKPLGQAKISSQ